LLAAAFVNETLENKGVVGYNTDAIADFFFFDIGGIILFSFDAPSRFFSHQVVIADWSLQPSFTLPNGELHNVGNYFAAKWALPFYRRLSLFSWYGEASTLGLSFALNDDYSLSAAVGGAAIHITNTATHSVENVVSFVPTGAIFLDRHNSLLASLQITNVQIIFTNQPSLTNPPAHLTFGQPKPVPYDLPFGKCLFMDTTFLPGTLTMQVFGHEIELLPRVLILDHDEHSWRSEETIVLDVLPPALPPRTAK